MSINLRIRCSKLNNQMLFEKYFRDTLDTLHNRKVVVVGPSPEYEHPIPEMAGKAALFRTQIDNIDTDFQLRGKEPLVILNGFKKDFPNLHLIDLYPTLCPNSKCQYLNEGQTLYSDAHHISLFGNQFLQPLFSKHLSDD